MLIAIKRKINNVIELVNKNYFIFFYENNIFKKYIKMNSII